MTSLSWEDYEFLIDSLNSCTNAAIIADFIDEWKAKYLKNNPGFLYFLLNITTEKYSIYGMEINYEKLNQRDLVLYKHYKYPALEFASDYIISLIQEEDENDKRLMLEENEIKYGEDILSFNIKDKYKDNLIKLTRLLNVHIDFLKEKPRVEELFVAVLISKNISVLNRKEHTIVFNCQTQEMVQVFENLKEVYKPKYFETVIERSGLFYSKQLIQITRTLLYKEKNKLQNSELLKKSIIDKIFRECYPNNIT